MSNDVEAITYGVNGHVLTRILLDGVFYYTDPDYGIGPYHADLLKPDLKAIYQTSSRPFAADQVAEMISNKADDGAYYSEAYFESLRQLRRALYRISDSMAYAFFAIGAGLIASLAWGRDLPPLK